MASGPEDQEPYGVVKQEASVGALQSEWVGSLRACSFVKPEASADLWGVLVLWDHLVFASVGEAVSAGHWGAWRPVGAVVACVDEGVLGASVGWNGVGRVEIQGVLLEKMGVLVGV